MGNVIGEPLERYVVEQINARQYLHGTGVRTTTRSDVQINLLNSNTSWIKLGSAISVSSDRLEDIGFTHTEREIYKGMGLAKNNILFGGTSTLGQNEAIGNSGKVYKYDALQQREGFLPRDPNSSYTYDPKFGFSPMAGIESIDVKTLNRGSLKKATVKLKANDRSQFNIIDLLYLRLGYTVLLEWGNSIYTPDGINKILVRNTLMEELFFDKTQNGSYLDMLDPIEKKRSEYAGNYDGLLGKISNFSWAFNPDGTYDIELTIISLGDVIESLKTNLSIDKGTTKFLQNTTGTKVSEDESSEEPDVIEENKDANLISSLLYIWKYLNPTPRGGAININTTGDGQTHPVGSFLKSTQIGSDEENISSTTFQVEFKITWNTEETVEEYYNEPVYTPVKISEKL
jgi:hypothetical protein